MWLPVAVLCSIILATARSSAQEAIPEAASPAPAAVSMSDTDGTRRELGRLSEVLAQVRQNHVDDPDARRLSEGAIRGMLAALDPYSQYYDADAYQSLQTDTRGKFGGVGMYIGVKQDRITVISPIEDTPAFRAGILSGDVISSIDGASTVSMSADDAASKMRGEPGTEVTLTLLRAGRDEPVVVTLTRDIITVRSVKWHLIHSNVGYVRITQFMEPTAHDVANAIAELTKMGALALILDLRSNPGGLLSSAVAIAGMFLNEGNLVVYTQGRSGREDFTVSAPLLHTDLPVDVLVNSGSASASEIVAGALQAHHRGMIMGSTTFGKASVQKIFPLQEGDGASAVKLTIAHYYTPSGVDINKVGIKPDVELAAGSALERDMWRKLRSSDALKTFLQGESPDLLKAIEAFKADNTTDRLYRKYQAFLKSASEQNIVLSEGLIRFAIASETVNETDDFEYDPQIAAAIEYLRAFDVYRALRQDGAAESE